MGELFTALAYVVGGVVFYYASRSERARPLVGDHQAAGGKGQALSLRSPELLIVLWALVGAAIGAKLTQLVAQGWPITISPAAALDPATGGRSLLGGMIGGWISVELAKRYYGIKRPMGDAFAFALAAGEAVGRIGCYFNGCCYGKVCDLPWAVEQHGALRHPSQIYSAITAALIFFVLLAYRSNRSYQVGSIFKLYLVLFAASRFLIEFTREQTGLIAGLSVMQWFCLEILVALGIGYAIRQRRLREAM